MPVIVEAPRSGTTLLRFMLDAHPEMAIPPETGFLALGPTLMSDGPTRRNEFFRAVTAFPEGAPLWGDFQIPMAVFQAELDYRP